MLIFNRFLPAALALSLGVSACATVPDNSTDAATAAPVTPAAPGRPATHSYNFDQFESGIRADIDTGKLPSIAFAIIKGGEIIHENAFGWADREHRVAASVDTPYPLASATKPIVATALMILRERGRIDLDAPAARYAGDWLSPAASDQPLHEYTVRQLLNHTSGLPTYARIYWRDQGRPVQSLEENFRKYGITVQPAGAVSEYSNLGYGLLGHIIAEASGSTLARFLEAEVFEPLGMRNSMMVDSFATPNGAARKYDPKGAPLPPTYNDTPGAGNVYASAHDLALFGAFHLADDPRSGPAVLSARSKRMMRHYVEPGAIYPYYGSSRYGLGWYFRTRGGDDIVWHEGGMPGASTIMLLLPGLDIAVAVLINTNDVNSRAEEIANGLVQVVEPGFEPVSFDAAEGFTEYSGESDLIGRWEGSIDLQGEAFPWALEFGADGSVYAEFKGRSGRRTAPEPFRVLLKGNLVIATFGGTLPASDMAQSGDGYVLLRLLRRDNRLSGAAIAYASPSRLEHLLPFAAELRREMHDDE